MRAAGWLKHLCEYAGGERDAPPPGFPISPASALWGVWWAALAGVIYAFCGQSSKFIYIDF